MVANFFTHMFCHRMLTYDTKLSSDLFSTTLANLYGCYGWFRVKILTSNTRLSFDPCSWYRLTYYILLFQDVDIWHQTNLLPLFIEVAGPVKVFQASSMHTKYKGSVLTHQVLWLSVWNYFIIIIIISAIHATARRWPPQPTPCTSILSHPHPLTATNFLDVLSISFWVSLLLIFLLWVSILMLSGVAHSSYMSYPLSSHAPHSLYYICHPSFTSYYFIPNLVSLCDV